MGKQESSYADTIAAENRGGWFGAIIGLGIIAVAFAYSVGWL